MNYEQRLYCFFKDEKGAELAEYAVGVALLVVVGLVVYKVLGNSINDSTSGTGAKVIQASTTSFP
jgi:Flp pilus assembly pilin Flp